MLRVLAIDYGEKRIGFAVSDALGMTAQGLETYERRDIDTDINHISGLLCRYAPCTLLMGLPKNMNGTLGPAAQKVLDFAGILKERLNVDSEFWDERLSTAFVERALLEADISRKKRRKVIDKLAAVTILQGYLDFTAAKNR